MPIASSEPKVTNEYLSYPTHCLSCFSLRQYANGPSKVKGTNIVTRVMYRVAPGVLIFPETIPGSRGKNRVNIRLNMDVNIIEIGPVISDSLHLPFLMPLCKAIARGIAAISQGTTILSTSALRAAPLVSISTNTCRNERLIWSGKQ
jgi:hypothetical protein